MKAGYAGLFGIVVAFSAYQGTLRQSPPESTVRAKASSESVSSPSNPDSNLPGVQKFPTIAGGMCKLTLDVKANPPCGICQSICPGTELAHLIGDYFTADSASDSMHWNVSDRGRSMIRFVIASVPDPVHTHMALLFDRGIETIQSVAPYSPLQTPLSEESILQGIVSALRKKHARVVVIRAADPLDMIFLSRYLRQNYPQARLVTVRNSFHDLQVDLASVTSQALIQAASNWKTEERAGAEATPKSGDTAEPESGNEKTTPKNAPLNPKLPNKETRALERFLCLFYLNVILVPLRRLQTIILALAGVFVFVLMSYSSYPFESRESFHVLLISIFFAISLIVGIVYGQMYSNSLLSVITNTTQGELGVDFWVKLGSFVFIPLLSILSVQFPGLNNFLFSWLQPALQSVK